MEDKPNFDSRYLIELESIRGLMAWWVVLGHTYSYYQAWLDFIPHAAKKLLLATAIPVNIFICLSGYLICASLHRREQRYIQFLAKRIARLFPLYLSVLLLAAFYFEDRYQVRATAPWLTTPVRADFAMHSKEVGENFLTHFLLSSALLQGIVPNELLNHAASAFLAPAWSLSLEWQFYLLAPLLMGGIKQKFSMSIPALILAGAIISFALKLAGLTFDYGAFLPIKIGFFMIGSFAACMVQERRKEQEGKKDFLIVCAAISLFVFAGVEKLPSIASAILWLSGLALCLWGESNSLSSRILARARGLLRIKFLGYLGKISYATYLCHVLLLDFSVWILLKLSVHALSPNSIIAFVAAIFSLTFFISVLLYKFIELPGMRWGKLLSRYEK